MEWKYIVEAIIAVIILVIFVPMIFKTAGNVWSLLTEKLGIISYSPIEKAILCSYYRCVKGCDSPEVLEYCSEYEEACSLPLAFHLDKDGKICDLVAKQFPIEITLKKMSEINKDRLKDKIGIDCITTKYANPNFVLLPKDSLTKVTREKCSYGPWYDHHEIDDAIRYTSIKEGKYYVYTKDNRLTDVITYQPYTIISSRGSAIMSISKGEFRRIVVDDEKKEHTSKGEYVFVVKDLGEDNGKKWCIINISNSTLSYSKILVLKDYPQFCFQTYKGWYLCIKLDDVNQGDEKVGVRVYYYNSKPEGYKSPVDAEKSCKEACKDATSIGEVLRSSTCRDSCETYESHIDSGDGWCKAIEDKSYCCCEYNTLPAP